VRSGIAGQWPYNANNELLAYGGTSFDHDAGVVRVGPREVLVFT